MTPRLGRFTVKNDRSNCHKLAALHYDVTFLTMFFVFIYICILLETDLYEMPDGDDSSDSSAGSNPPLLTSSDNKKCKRRVRMTPTRICYRLVFLPGGIKNNISVDKLGHGPDCQFRRLYFSGDAVCFNSPTNNLIT